MSHQLCGCRQGHWIGHWVRSSAAPEAWRKYVVLKPKLSRVSVLWSPTADRCPRFPPVLLASAEQTPPGWASEACPGSVSGGDLWLLC